MSNLKPKEETKTSGQNIKTTSIKQTNKPNTSSQKDSKIINSISPSIKKQSINNLNASQQTTNAQRITSSKASSFSIKTENKITNQNKQIPSTVEVKDGNAMKQKIQDSKPKYKLTKEVFKILNKNTIYLILSFLNAKETFDFGITSKSMNIITKEAVQSIIYSLQEKRKKLLQINNLNEQEIQAIIYLKHFYVYKSKSGCYIGSHLFTNPDLKSLIHTLWQVVAEKNSQGAQYFDKDLKDEHYDFQVSHNFQNASKEKIPILEQCLKIYTEEYIQSLEVQYSYYKTYINLFQKYLKGIKLVIELNLNYQSIELLEKSYFANIFKIDQNIYFYEQMLRNNKETLHIYTFDYSKGCRPKKIKSFPHQLFQ